MIRRPALWLVAAGVVVVDQTSKQWVLNSLDPYVLHPVLGDWFGIELVFNSGAAFSFANSTTWLLTIVAVLVSVGIVYYARRAQTTAAIWVFGIGLGGAIGNLIDRLFRAPSFGQGHVVDFLNYNNWFVGNVADIAIVVAAAVAVIMGLFGKNILAPLDGAPHDDAVSSEDTIDEAVINAPIAHQAKGTHPLTSMPEVGSEAHKSE